MSGLSLPAIYVFPFQPSSLTVLQILPSEQSLLVMERIGSSPKLEGSAHVPSLPLRKVNTVFLLHGVYGSTCGNERLRWRRVNPPKLFSGRMAGQLAIIAQYLPWPSSNIDFDNE